MQWRVSKLEALQLKKWEFVGVLVTGGSPLALYWYVAVPVAGAMSAASARHSRRQSINPRLVPGLPPGASGRTRQAGTATSDQVFPTFPASIALPGDAVERAALRCQSAPPAHHPTDHLASRLPGGVPEWLNGAVSKTVVRLCRT